MTHKSVSTAGGSGAQTAIVESCPFFSWGEGEKQGGYHKDCCGEYVVKRGGNGPQAVKGGWIQRKSRFDQDYPQKGLGKLGSSAPQVKERSEKPVSVRLPADEGG